MPIPIDKVIDAAEKTGFGSELRAAAILKNQKWNTNQNVYFIDKDEGKGRELDILAYRIFHSLDEKPELNCMIVLCIEVKRTLDPYIFFCNSRSQFDGSRGYGIFHWTHNVDNSVLPFKYIEKRKPLQKLSRIARSYSCFKNGQTQHIQSGIISAFKAAIHERDNCAEKYSEKSGDICFFIPVLLVDGEIFECYYEDDKYQLSAEESNCLIYAQNYHSKNYGRLSNDVFVVNFKEFYNLIEDMSYWGESMLREMKNNRSVLANR